MDMATITEEPTYAERIEILRQAKLRHTEEKRRVLGPLDMDDLPFILPPPERRATVRIVSGSGLDMNDAVFSDFRPRGAHPSGGIFGARECGETLRALMRAHPPYVDPASSLAGACMTHLIALRDPAWHPDFDYPHLKPEQERYRLHHGIGAVQHFCQDMTIGLSIGWGGILAKIREYRRRNTDEEAQELYDGLEAVVLGFQDWIGRHAEAARAMADDARYAHFRRNLLEIASINEHLVADPPRTFREACQWTLWYQLGGKMYNMGGSLGRIDQFLFPFYERDRAAGTLSDEEATFHLACLFIMDTSYTQLGGPDAGGKDTTNALSFLVLEAAHWLRVPVNVGVSVGRDVDERLLRRGVEILFEDRTGIPKFLGVDRTSEGFARNGYPIALGRERAYSGCHWCAIPGREYTVNDCVKVNFAAVFDVALHEMMASDLPPSTESLWVHFERHLRRAVDVVAMSLDFHMDHMYRVFPELHLDLLCHGPIERGRDATHGGVEFYNLCVDGAGLATVADSFAALEQRVEREKRISWDDCIALIDGNWQGEGGERMRLMMKSVPRYGSGSSRADAWGLATSRAFTAIVKSNKTPAGFTMIPGIFSWAATIAMGKDVLATPNGRRARDPISHGPNPDPGFRRDSAPTALALAVAAVQPGYGNTAPMQIELDPGLGRGSRDRERIVDLIRTHFAMGGTQINMNILDRQAVLEAHRDPAAHPDLVVRVTGFSAYFASLSPAMRQIVVDRILCEEP